jgi:hypothetical protein
MGTPIKTRIGLFPALFVGGGLQQFLSWRLYVYFAYASSTPDSGSFVDNKLTNLGISLLGAIATCIFARRFIRKLRDVAPSTPLFDVMLRGGLYGVGATFSAFLAFTVLASVYLAVQTVTSMHAGLVALPSIAFVWFLELGFLEAFPAALCIPMGFLVWSVSVGMVKLCGSRCPLVRAVGNFGV